LPEFNLSELAFHRLEGRVWLLGRPQQSYIPSSSVQLFWHVLRNKQVRVVDFSPMYFQHWEMRV